MAGGGFGSMALGSGPFGSGSGAGLDEARQVARNAVDVTFLDFPKASDPATVDDALNPARWTLAAFDPSDSTIRLAQFVENTSNPKVVRVFFDGPLDAFAVYVITGSGISTVFGIPILPPADRASFSTFDTFRVRADVPAEQQRTDLSNPQLVADATIIDPPPLGTYQIDDRGDYALERGRPYLRKRIFRRASSAIHSFFHLPGYGFAEPLKSGITPDVLRRLQARAQSQVLMEPDVVSVSVTVTQDAQAPGVAILRISAIDREGNVVSQNVPVNLAGPIT